MRTLDQTRTFRRDQKREMRGRFRNILEIELLSVVELLLNDQALPARYGDHPLTGNWSGHRDCHLRPDLVLIYTKPDDDTLLLVRLGSHSELRI